MQRQDEDEVSLRKALHRIMDTTFLSEDVRVAEKSYEEFHKHHLEFHNLLDFSESELMEVIRNLEEAPDNEDFQKSYVFQENLVKMLRRMHLSVEYFELMIVSHVRRISGDN